MTTKPRDWDQDERALRAAGFDPVELQRHIDAMNRARKHAEDAAAAVRTATVLDRKGKVGARGRYIYAFAMANPERSARWLYDNRSGADRKAIGKISFSAFRKHIPKRPKI